jgi:hypothetical protein
MTEISPDALITELRLAGKTLPAALREGSAGKDVPRHRPPPRCRLAAATDTTATDPYFGPRDGSPPATGSSSMASGVARPLPP